MSDYLGKPRFVIREGDRCTGGTRVLSGIDHPSLSPFNSGCPR